MKYCDKFIHGKIVVSLKIFGELHFLVIMLGAWDAKLKRIDKIPLAEVISDRHLGLEN